MRFLPYLIVGVALYAVAQLIFRLELGGALQFWPYSQHALVEAAVHPAKGLVQEIVLAVSYFAIAVFLWLISEAWRQDNRPVSWGRPILGWFVIQLLAFGLTWVLARNGLVAFE